MELPNWKNSLIPQLEEWNEEQIKQGKLRFLHVARHCVPNFTVDERNKDIINDLFYYFHRIKGGRLDPAKGLWIEGPPGTGKSILISIFAKHIRTYWNDKAFKIYNCTSISNEFSRRTSNEVDLLDIYTANRFGESKKPIPMCFDELGREPIPSVSFGQRLNVMEHILHIRYSIWQELRLRTYVTTNLGAEEVENLYHDYIRDRRKEMFNIIAMTGDSRRK